MIEIRKTDIYAHWLDSLRDIRARARVQARVERLAFGNTGDVKPVGEGVSEMRIDYGPGYRVYYTMRGQTLKFYWPVAINDLRPLTLRQHCA
ncbi:MAG TPA: type II toxin-antitoxin system RelE/ParE family toxin [Dissulfurispiraceae bacterium]|nr:type II toxin-antitoxin system RelE/ParE family toxin [Dissulfurispiraceae bacterium]